jgi:hypothetical protein
MRVDCADRAGGSGVLDCGKNDDFNAAPVAGRYLATHWNVANNRYLTNIRPVFCCVSSIAEGMF